MILKDSIVRALQSWRTSWVTTVMAVGGDTVDQMYLMVELMNQNRSLDVMIQIGANKSSDSEEPNGKQC